MTEPEKTPTMLKEATDASVAGCIYLVVIGFIPVATLYFCGWTILWGDYIPIDNDGLLLHQRGIALRINLGHYGFWMTPRFFDSPFIQWIGFFAAMCSLAPLFRDKSKSKERRRGGIG